MSFDLLLLFLLTFTGGLFYAWLGAGAGAILVPLLPYVSNLDALGAVQASLLMGFLISLINSLVFQYQKLILWSWIIKALIFIITSAFFAGFCIGFLTNFQIRYLLWSFFLFILLFPFILELLKFKDQNVSKEHKKPIFLKKSEVSQDSYKKEKYEKSIFFHWILLLFSLPKLPSFRKPLSFLKFLSFLRKQESFHPSFKNDNPEQVKQLQLEPYKMKFFYLCNILAGFSSGFTGVGGGMILSPFFHESRLIPAKNIPAVMSVLLLCVVSFSLLGQITQNSLNLRDSSEIFLVCLQILPGYLLGSILGYIVNIKQNNPQIRRQLIRFLVLLLFLKMTVEIFRQITS